MADDNLHLTNYKTSKQMTAAKILRIAVIAEIALVPVYYFVNTWASRLLPSEALTVEENQVIPLLDFATMTPGGIAMIAAGVLFVVIGIASIVGLLKLRRWGAWLYLISHLLSLPVPFLTGFVVLHPMHQMLDVICFFIPGFIIALAFFSDAIPKKERL